MINLLCLAELFQHELNSLQLIRDIVFSRKRALPVQLHDPLDQPGKDRPHPRNPF
jgi:hypothetical protein